MALMTIDDIEETGSVLTVNIPQTRANRKRSFIINGERGEVNMMEIYRKYVALRPPHCTNRRFFLYYKLGKCSQQVVGVNTFGKFPSEVARFLGLSNPSSFTGHCYRRTSDALKRSGGWPAVTMAECHFAEPEAPDDVEDDDDVIAVEEVNIKIEEEDVKDVATTSGSGVPSSSHNFENWFNCQINVQADATLAGEIKQEK